MNNAMRKRIGELLEQLEDCKSGIEEILEQEEEYRESIPENMQSGERYCRSEERVDSIDTCISDLENIISALEEVQE